MKLANKRGEILVQGDFWEVKPAAMGRFFAASVVDKEKNRVIVKYGIISPEGNWILEPKYDYVGEFRKVNE